MQWECFEDGGVLQPEKGWSVVQKGVEFTNQRGGVLICIEGVECWSVRKWVAFWSAKIDNTMCITMYLSMGVVGFCLKRGGLSSVVQKGVEFTNQRGGVLICIEGVEYWSVRK